MSEDNGQRLPNGWTETCLAAIVEPRSGKVDPQTIPDVKFIGMEQVEAHSTRLLGTVRAGSMKSAANAFVAGDVLYGRLRSYLNKVYQPDFDGLCSGEFIVLSQSPAVLGKFLKYRLNAGDFVRFASRINAGDRPRVDFDQIKAFNILLPPKREQERIAESLDELLSELDVGVATLEKIRERLALYRASILKAAVEGALTADRRAVHPQPEPASDLLERILAERRRLWEEEQLAKFKMNGREPPENWKAKYKEPVAPDSARLPALPDEWCWATVEQLGEVRLGRQRAPQHHQGDHMRPYLRVANVYEDRLDLTDVKQMNFTPEEFKTYALRHGDLLLNEGQSPELVGRPAMYRGEVPGCCYQKTLLRFRAYDGVLPAYALSVFRAYLLNGRFRRSANITTSIAHLAAERFIVIEFPLPPLVEQTAIVEAVEDQLSVIDHLEADLDAKVKSAEALRQSILRHAFSGQLVPQDTNDEPASELLEGIAQERQARNNGNRHRRPAPARKRV